MAETTPDQARIDLALKALYQIEALLPILQRRADKSGDEPDAMLGLLGRVRQMNDAAMTLLSDADDDDLIESTREAVLGRREVDHA